jgi:hypothetical protein
MDYRKKQGISFPERGGGRAVQAYVKIYKNKNNSY